MFVARHTSVAFFGMSKDVDCSVPGWQRPISPLVGFLFVQLALRFASFLRTLLLIPAVIPNQCICQSSCLQEKSKHESIWPQAKRCAALFHQKAMEDHNTKLSWSKGRCPIVDREQRVPMEKDFLEIVWALFLLFRVSQYNLGRPFSATTDYVELT